MLVFIIACFLYYAGRAPFVGQWDSFDYLKQTVTHRLSDLAFGRPVFIGYNIIFWEIAKRIFSLDLLQVETVAVSGIILLGACGVLLFRRLARGLLPPPQIEMATLAFLVSPMYAVYAGSVMTEVPMLTVVLAAAVVLWESSGRFPVLGPLTGGLLFGLAVGIREQAITLAAALLWILWVRFSDPAARLRAWLLFSISAGTTIALPILILYLHDPTAFWVRTRVWIHAIPTGQIHFVRNVEATVLFALGVCPGAWLALIGAGLVAGCRRLTTQPRAGAAIEEGSACAEDRRLPVHTISHPVWGVICGLLVPLAVLWRDADVQMHPRYLLILLPSVLIVTAALYARAINTTRGAIGWAVLQVVVFGAAATVLEPIRQIQYEKRQYAELVRAKVPDEALLIPGGFSPVLDYYRGLGIRPNWRILWSGWGWNSANAEAAIRDSWANHKPVYLCDAPYGWLMLEDERLDLYFILKDHRRQVIAPGITRYYSQGQGKM